MPFSNPYDFECQTEVWRFPQKTMKCGQIVNMHNTENSDYYKNVLQIHYSKGSIYCVKYVKTENMYDSSNVSPVQKCWRHSVIKFYAISTRLEPYVLIIATQVSCNPL